MFFAATKVLIAPVVILLVVVLGALALVIGMFEFTALIIGNQYIHIFSVFTVVIFVHTHGFT